MTTSVYKTSQATFFAREVLSFCGISNPTELPIEDLAMAIGISGVVPRYMNGAEGRIMTKNGLFLISYSDQIKHIGKKRFVIAHEIGHFVMHQDILLSDRIIVDNHASLISTSSIEVEANTFASELLLPKILFQDNFTQEVPRIKTMKQIANKYKLSLLFTAMRYKEVGNVPVCLVYSSKGIVKWVSSSPGCLLSFIEVGSKVPRSSLAGAIKSGMNLRVDHVEDIDPQHWFSQDYNLGKAIHSRFHEQCYRIGKNDVLTMLWHS